MFVVSHVPLQPLNHLNQEVPIHILCQIEYTLVSHGTYRYNVRGGFDPGHAIVHSTQSIYVLTENRLEPHLIIPAASTQLTAHVNIRDVFGYKICSLTVLDYRR